MAFGVIYLLIDGTNDKEYVGQTTQTVEERFKEHKRCKTSNIGRAIRKHGAENFSAAILKVCESQEKLNCWERHFIKSRGTRWPNGYNNTDGGEGGWERTSESVVKMSRSGMKHSNESKDLIAQSLTGKPGRPLTEEEKAHLSAVIPNKRKVICVETGIIYDSITEAARHNNISLQSIHRVCQNKRKTTGGFHWKFADNSETKDKHAVICIETKEEFESLTAAARAHNLKNRTGISNACKNPERTAGGYHWRFVETAQA